MAPDAARDRTASQSLERARLHALLPSSGIEVGPPEAEDKLEISPLAHAILRAGEELDSERWQRTETIRVAYLRGDWETNDLALAARLLPGLMEEDTQEADPTA